MSTFADRLRCATCELSWAEDAPGRYSARCGCAAGPVVLADPNANECTAIVITPDLGDSMLSRFVARLAGYALGLAALVVAAWWAVTRGKDSTHTPPTPAPPSLNDERDEVVEDVAAMDAGAIVAELEKRGY